jgi:DNA-binding HxlR family transcriptional regulator
MNYEEVILRELNTGRKTLDELYESCGIEDKALLRSLLERMIIEEKVSVVIRTDHEGVPLYSRTARSLGPTEIKAPMKKIKARL